MIAALKTTLLTACLLSASTVASGTEFTIDATGRDDAESQTRLAIRHEHAEGVRRDYVAAQSLYCQAANAGYADAQYRLGWMYANGRGVERSDAIAATLFERAAQQGHEQSRQILRYIRTLSGPALPACMKEQAAATLKLTYELSEPRTIRVSATQ